MATNILFKGGLDKDKTLKQIEKDIKDLSKSFGVELETISLKNIDKATSQIQNQINQLSKNLSININKVNLENDGALKDIQNQINSSLKGEKINLEVKSNIKDSIEDFNVLDNKIKNSVLKQEQYLTQLENKLNKVKERSIVQHTKNENYDNTRDLNSIANIQNRINDIKARNVKLSQEEKNFMSQQVVELDRYIGKEATKNAEINRSTRFLTSQLRSLESLKIRVENRGKGGSEQSRLSNELEKQISLYQKMIQENKILGSVERQRIQKTSNDIRNQGQLLVRYQSQFSQIFSRMKDYFIGTSLLYTGMNAFRQGFNTIQEIDSSLTDLRKVTNLTKEEYADFVDYANQKSRELSGSTSDFIQSTANFVQMGYQNINEAKKLAQDSQIYMNIGELSQEESTKSLITILKSFNLEASKSTEILDKTNQVANNFPITVKGLAGGMSRAGSVLRNASNDIDQSISLLTAANTSIQDPIRVSNGIKSIALNLEKVKMKAGKATPQLQNMMMAITKGRVSLVQANGEFKSTYQIIKELGSVWNDGTLKANEKALILQEVAGKHQANVLASLLNNAKSLDAIYQESKNSMGSANTENQRFMDSINGRLNALRENAKGLTLDLSNTDFLKGMISGINSGITGLRGLIKTFHTIPSTVAIASASMTIFNQKTRNLLNKNNFMFFRDLENAYKSVAKQSKVAKVSILRDWANLKNQFKSGEITNFSYTKSLVGIKAKMAAVKLEAMATRVAVTALQGAISFGIGLLITYGTEKLISLIDSIHTTKAELKEMNSEFANTSKQTNETISKAEEKYSKIKELQNQLSNTKNEQEKIELQSKLNKLQSEMVDLLPQSKSGLDSQNQSIANNNALIEESIKLKKQEREEEAKKIAQENSKHMDVFDKYFENKNNYDNMSSSNSVGLNKFQKLMFMASGHGDAIKKANTQEVNKELQNQLSTITAIKQAVADMKASGMSDIEIKAQFGGTDVFEKIKEFDSSLKSTQQSADNAKPSLDELSNPLDQIKESANSAADSLDKLGSKFSKLTGNIGLVKKAMDEFSKTGKISTNTIGSILSSGDTRVISLLKDKQNFMKNSIALEKTMRGESNQTYQQALAQADSLRQQGITDLSSKEAIDQQAQQSAINSSNNITNAKLNNYATDVNAQADAENTKDTNASNSTNTRTGMAQNETNQKATMYGEDAKNHGELEGTKVENSANAANSMLDVNGQMVNGFANGYSADASNFQKLMNDKLDMADACATQLDWTFAQVFKQTQSLSKAVRETMMAKEGLGTSMDIPKKPSILEMGSWNPIYKGQHSVNSGFDPMEVGSGAVDADYDPVTPDYSNGGKGASAAKKKKDKKKKNEVDIKDIEDKIDAYKSLQDSIDDVNNELEETKTLEEQANGSEKLKYMNQELVLYKKKKQAVNDIIWQKKQEAKALESILKNNGFDASGGDISNYKERLETIKSNVNAMNNSNKAKEQAIKDYKKLKEQADKYFELTSKEIPSLNNQWQQLNKTIREVSENQVKLMGDAEREMTGIVENQVEERRKILEEDLKKQEEEYEKKEKLLEKETNKVKEELQKQRDEYNKKNDDESFEKNLKEKQNELSKINSQIDSVRRDNSSDGQSRLKELLSKKEEVEKDLNNIIRDRQKEKSNELFDKAMEQIDKGNQNASDKLNKEKEDFSKEKDEILKNFDEKYNKETISELAKGMISKGFIEIEGHVIKLRDALNSYYKENGEVFADSSLKMQEYIDNLELTKKLYQELASINNNLGISSNNIRYNNGNNVIPSIPKIASFMAMPRKDNKSNINIKTDLHVGTVNEGSMEDMKKLIDERDRSIVNKITSQLHVH